MKTMSIIEAAKHIEDSANFYIKEVFRDVTYGSINKIFNSELKKHKFYTTELLTPDSPRIYDENFMRRNKIMFNRQMTPRVSEDIDEVRCHPTNVINKINKAVKLYVSWMPQNSNYATVPALYVSVMGFQVNWFLWGYVGSPPQN